MGAYLSEPVTEKETSSGSGNGLEWAASSMQGWRQSMEDSHITMTELPGFSDLALFGVFDGHGGREVALFCREQMPDEVCRHLCRSVGSASSSSAAPSGAGDEVLAAQVDPSRPIDSAVMGATLRHAFHAMDKMLEQPAHQKTLLGMKTGAGGAEGEAADSRPKPKIASALQTSIQSELDQAKGKGSLTKQEATRLMMKISLLKRIEEQQAMSPTEDIDESTTAADGVGCTAVCVLLSQKEVVCANAGDSRAIMCRGGLPVELSHDHKPNDDRERRRIAAAGGTIEETPVGTGKHARVNYRINGNLNLSRSIGDLQYKKRADLPQEEQMICSTPDLLVETRSPQDEFLVVACDGIWDVKSNAQVCDFVKKGLSKKRQLGLIIEDLLNDCITANPKETCGLGADNMTCIIVKFKEFDPGEFNPNLEGSKDGDTPKQPGCFPFRCLRT
mmetsp:Transcript_13371/g.25255  ORF Transcript_13371/g.25255 Transcript_13371/m.25255 type:complete len:446 (-) Transcript_13371:64-1401(-)